MQEPLTLEHRCPYLGLNDDPCTWLSFPSERNCCHHTGRPIAVALSRQATLCLKDCTLCPSYQAAAGADLRQVNQTRWFSRSRRKRLVRLSIQALVLLTLGSILAIFVVSAVRSIPNYRSTVLSRVTASTEAAVDAVPTRTSNYPTPATTIPAIPTITALSAPSWTPTFLPSPTPRYSPTPSLTPAVTAIIGFGTNLRTGPSKEFPITDYLLVGDVVVLLGRNIPHSWVYIRTDEGLEGWVAVTQFDPPIDISNLPLGPGIIPPSGTLSSTP